MQDLIKKESAFQCLFVLCYSVCVSVKIIMIKKKGTLYLFSLGAAINTWFITPEINRWKASVRVSYGCICNNEGCGVYSTHP